MLVPANDLSKLYNPLLPGFIRLMRLNAHSNGNEGAVVNEDWGELVEAFLEDAPPYYALSHCWGPQGQKVAVKVNKGVELHVASDLATGIHRLRELAGSSDEEELQQQQLSPPVRHIWIDNICINQRDVAERASQVAMMGRIYSSAIGTLVWLGPDDGSASTKSAWRLVDRIYDIFRSQHPAASVHSDIPVQVYSDAFHEECGLPAWSDPVWGDLKELAGLRWFGRTWVIQEVVLSPQDPIFIHGTHTIYPWSRLGWAVMWLLRKGYLRHPVTPKQLFNIDAISMLRRSPRRWPFDALMSVTQTKFQATDQRDKVFGLLGLAAESSSGSEIPDALRPDYTVPVAEVYQRVARFLLQRGGCSLAMLTRTRGTIGSLSRTQRLHQDLGALPSWCPDWSDFRVNSRDIRTSLSWIHFSDKTKPANFGFPLQYVASSDVGVRLRQITGSRYSGRNSSRSQEDEPGALGLVGIDPKEVVRVVVPFNPCNFSRDEFDKYEFTPNLNLAFRAAIEVLPQREDNGNPSVKVGGNVLLTEDEQRIASWAEHFVKAITAQQHALTGRDWDQGRKDGIAFIHRLLQKDSETGQILMSQEGASSKGDGGSRQNSIDFLHEISHKAVDEGGAPDEFAVVARNFCFNRCFIITSAGNMGLAPSDTQEGDVLALLFGGGVPYIVRRQPGDAEKAAEGWWTFVGEAYVHGFMEGEAIAAWREGKVVDTVWAFR